MNKLCYPQILSAFVAASFNLQLGLNIGYSAILIPQLEQHNSTIPVTKDESAWLASVYALTVPLGSFFVGSVMERFGRLNAIKLAALPCAVGWSAIAIAPNYPVIILGRILCAISVGIGTNPAVVYISEISDPELRGSLNSIAPMLAALGTLVVYATGAIISWRFVAWLNSILGILPAILVQFCAKESPIWLIRRGKEEKALKSLKYLYKNHPKCEEEDEFMYVLKYNKLKIEQENKKNFVQKSSFSEFKKPTGYKPMLILILLFLIQQCSGIYITMIYAVTFIRETGTTMNAYYASIFIGLIRFIMSLFTLWLLRKFNRRPLLMISSLGMAVCISLSGLFTYLIKNEMSDLTAIPLIFLLFYVCSSLLGLLTIPWTMTAEMFPVQIRGMGQSIIFGVSTFLMFLTAHFYRSFQDLVGGPSQVQWSFACVSFLGFLFGWLLLPETHGKTLAEIQRYFIRQDVSDVEIHKMVNNDAEMKLEIGDEK